MGGGQLPQAPAGRGHSGPGPGPHGGDPQEMLPARDTRAPSTANPLDATRVRARGPARAVGAHSAHKLEVTSDQVLADQSLSHQEPGREGGIGSGSLGNSQG